MKKAEKDNKTEFTEEEKELIRKLLEYPSIENAFASGMPLKKLQTVQRLNSVIENLERVVRRGSQSDAEKAKRAAESCRITLNLFGEIEQLRVSAQKK